MYSQTRLGRPPTRTQRRLVATPHYLASSTDFDILRDVRSAVNAAIAANATLCVVYPHMAGLGGDGFWLIGGDNSDIAGINASGPAAVAATRDYYAELGHDEIAERGSTLALTMPGAVDGWGLAHEELGELPWERLFEDAISHACEGLCDDRRVHRWIALDADVLAENSTAAETFLSEGAAPQLGIRLRQSSLTDLLWTIATHGPREEFYEKPVGEDLCDGLDEASLPFSSSAWLRGSTSSRGVTVLRTTTTT